MQLKNSIKYTYLNILKAFPIIYTKQLFTFLAIAMLVNTTSCKKSPPDYIANVYEQYFETNVLNTDFKVKLATDNGTDITAQYDDFKFRLLKNTYYDGPMTATKISDPSVVYTGTWSSNDDFGKLVISITQPANPGLFGFLNRQWKFTKKALPIMELAPWGTTEPKVLHMEKQ